MTQARRTLISLAETPYYHCITRCVRRAYLCGHDAVSNKTFDHRKLWLVERFKTLSTIFAVEICAYAVMSNHYHLVLYVDAGKADSWSDQEVVDRWAKLFKASAQALENQMAVIQSPAVQAVFQQKIRAWREHLKDISWFMKCLNEYMARRCNKEDACKGHFWEARFKSQALLDEKGLLTCMAYVDLNPVRAAMADTPEASDFTSIQERLVAHAGTIKSAKRTPRQKALLKHYKSYYANLRKSGARTGKRPKDVARAHPKECSLKPFGGSAGIPLATALPFTEQDYFNLLDATGRVIRQDKQGSIPAHLPHLLERMGVEEKSWLVSVQHFMDQYASVAGELETLRSYEDRGNLKGIKGVGIERRSAA